MSESEDIDEKMKKITVACTYRSNNEDVDLDECIENSIDENGELTSEGETNMDLIDALDEL